MRNVEVNDTERHQKLMNKIQYNYVIKKINIEGIMDPADCEYFK